MAKKSNKRLLYEKLNKIELEKESFSIISNNCWGAEIYIMLNKVYKTPFVGLFLFAPCYLKFLSDFRKNTFSNIKFKRNSKYLKDVPEYPIGELENGIEIYFQHYKSEKEAEEKWKRRADRIDFDNLYFKMDDRDLCTPGDIETFHSLPFEKKVSFTVNSFPEIQNNIQITSDTGSEFVRDGKSLFYESEKYFDIIEFINTGNVQNSLKNRILKSVLGEYK